MTADLSSVAREAAEREAERHWPTVREYSTAQTSAVFSVKELDAYCASALTRGFTDCASRLPSERDIEIAILGRTATQAAKAVLALIGEKISG